MTWDGVVLLVFIGLFFGRGGDGLGCSGEEAGG